MTLNCDTGPGSFVNIKITLKDKEVTTGFLSVMSSFSYLLLQAAKTLETYVGLTQDSAPSFRSCHLLPLSPGSFCAASCGDALQQWVWRDLSSQPRAGCTDSAGLCSSCTSPGPAVLWRTPNTSLATLPPSHFLSGDSWGCHSVSCSLGFPFVKLSYYVALAIFPV